MENIKKTSNMSMYGVLYILCAVAIPLVIIGVSGLIPESKVTWIFAIVTIALYTVGVCLAGRIIKINGELKEIIEVNKSLDKTLSNEERFKNIDLIIEESKEDKYKNIYSSFCNYRNSLRGICEEDTSGQLRRRFYSTSSASYFFDEDSVIYKNLYYKTINYITQALTGVGIFGTFLGII